MRRGPGNAEDIEDAEDVGNPDGVKDAEDAGSPGADEPGADEPGADEADDGTLEPDLDEAFDRTVEEGTHRLHRSWPGLLATATVAGMEVATGVLALLAVERATGSTLLGGVAFSIGFLALLLGHSELFTEGFLIPVTAVAAKRATFGQLAKLWGGTLVGNLTGGWAMSWLMMRAYPQLQQQAIDSARFFADSSWSLRSIALALIAGSSITLMTRMQHGTDAMIGKIAAAVAGATLLAGLQMFHSILDSLLIFAALNTGHAPFGYASWAHWFGLAVIGNVVGGVGLVTVLRMVRSGPRLAQERAENAGSKGS